MPFVVRRLQRMDLTIFREHSKVIKGRQRAINIDAWLIPYLSLPAPSEVTLRLRDPDTGRILVESHPFGRLQKNFRIHGRMIDGFGFLAYEIGDLMLLRFAGNVVTIGLFRDWGVESKLFRFLNDPTHVTYRRNMGVVDNANRIRLLEGLLSDFDPQLFFADEVEAIDAEPSSLVVRRSVQKQVSQEAYKKIRAACESNGAAGELFILERERNRLKAAGHEDLADRVKHVSEEQATGPFDILSFEGIAPFPGRERYIEVKSTSGDGMDFEISEAEWQFAEQKRDQHILCRVTQVTGDSPGCREVRDIVGHMAAGKVTKRAISYKVKIL